MTVALIDYGAGNLRSAERALVAAGAAAVAVTADPATVRSASRIVLPGVGAFGQCMGALAAIPGMIDALEDAVRRSARPFLGICVGMQLMAEAGEEFGTHRGLGWVRGTVRRLVRPGVRVPHMGWNRVESRSPLIAPADYYFVHGYALDGADPAETLATADHGGPLVAAVGAGSALGVQFHPEKSQAAGLALIARFLAWQP